MLGGTHRVYARKVITFIQSGAAPGLQYHHHTVIVFYIQESSSGDEDIHSWLFWRQPTNY
jgi:hypothetical protein